MATVFCDSKWQLRSSSRPTSQSEIANTFLRNPKLEVDCLELAESPQDRMWEPIFNFSNQAFLIEGGNLLKGDINVSGSKNAVLPLMTATLLAHGTSTIKNVPDLLDVAIMKKLLAALGCRVTSAGRRSLSIDTTTLHYDQSSNEQQLPDLLIKSFRSSVGLIGPLLARCGHVRMAFPGGCRIGARPIDQHLNGFKCLGATVTIKEDVENHHSDTNYIRVDAPPQGLHGGHVIFDIPTVLGTLNIIMAAACIPGEVTVLDNCAQEPEILELIQVLQRMGAGITLASGNKCRIVVHGRRHSELIPVPRDYRVMADRQEFGTFLIAGALLGDPLVIVGGIPSHQAALIDILRQMGAQIDIDSSQDRVIVRRPAANTSHASLLLYSVKKVETSPYPGFPTDIQAPLMAALTQCDGTSTLTETVFENRFQHVVELQRMGAALEENGNVVTIHGTPNGLRGARVTATDLRAGACLVLAALVAKGTSSVHGIFHIDRGYEGLERKLAAVGAVIQRQGQIAGGAVEKASQGAET